MHRGRQIAGRLLVVGLWFTSRAPAEPRAAEDPAVAAESGSSPAAAPEPPEAPAGAAETTGSPAAAPEPPEAPARSAGAKRRREFACRRQQQLQQKLRLEEQAYQEKHGVDEEQAGTKALQRFPEPTCDPGSGYPAYVILPGAYYTAEVGLAFLVHNELQFLPEGLESNSWPSAVTLGVAYTTLNQFLVESKPLIYLDDNHWLLSGTYLFRRYTDQFYGIGNDTPADYQPFLEYVLHLRSEVSRLLFARLYVGAIDDAKFMFDIEGKEVRDETGEIDSDAPPLLTDATPGYEPGVTHGIGVQVFWDSRDNIYAPTRGGYYFTSAVVKAGFLGSDYDYTEWMVDLRQFIPLFSGRHVLGLQLYHQMNFGDVPFHMMAPLGGAWQMRGYRRGRYRDLHQTVAQAEYRFPLFGRFSGVGFLSAGEVFGNDAFDWAKLRVAGGAGLRFRLNDTMFIRSDLAVGDQLMVIFNGGHAF